MEKKQQSLKNHWDHKFECWEDSLCSHCILFLFFLNLLHMPGTHSHQQLLPPSSPHTSHNFAPKKKIKTWPNCPSPHPKPDHSCKVPKKDSGRLRSGQGPWLGAFTRFGAREKQLSPRRGGAPGKEGRSEAVRAVSAHRAWKVGRALVFPPLSGEDGVGLTEAAFCPVTHKTISCLL